MSATSFEKSIYNVTLRAVARHPLRNGVINLSLQFHNLPLLRKRYSRFCPFDLRVIMNEIRDNLQFTSA